ncbi:MAG: dTMP kinase [Candidatus Eisenbacteria bacterium]|nr:dTMP kinase [Candidatus Eisenbacteria bacterium]
MALEGHRGVFITFEGVEGSGKSTQASRLAEALAERGHDVTLTREPGGTPLGERLRQILLDLGERGMTQEAELFLYLASRSEHVASVVEPALSRGGVVIADRFGDASVAYQGGGRSLGAALVERLNEVATRRVKPDVTFLLDLDPGTGLSRLSRRGSGEKDRIESEEVAFHERVRDTYLRSAEREPERFVVLDGALDADSLARLVMAEIDKLLESRRKG